MNKKVVNRTVIIITMLLILIGGFFMVRFRFEDLTAQVAQSLFYNNKKGRSDLALLREIQRLQAQIRNLNQKVEKNQNKGPAGLNISKNEIQQLTGKLNQLSLKMERMNRTLAQLTQSQSQNYQTKKSLNNLAKNKDTEKKPERNLANIVVSEVCVGLDSAKNEFIELYNPNSVEVNLKDRGLLIKLVNSSGDITEKQIHWNRETIPAKGYFMLASGKLEVGGQEFVPDARFSAQLTSTGGIVIGGLQGNVMDKIGWGSIKKPALALAVEGKGIIFENGLRTGRSVMRRQKKRKPN